MKETCDLMAFEAVLQNTQIQKEKAAYQMKEGSSSDLQYPTAITTYGTHKYTEKENLRKIRT